jgi:HEPN domain-containing protein
MRELAVRLNNRSIFTNRGTPWRSKAIAYMLKNPVYIGKIRWTPDNGETIIAQGRHEPIISDELFNKTQERLSRNVYNKGEHEKIRLPDFMLRGLVKCSNCGSTLVNHKKGTSLQCCTFVHGQCTVSHCVTKKAINKAVLDRIKEDLDIGDFVITPAAVHAVPSDNADEQIERLNRKLVRAAEAFESGAYDLAFFKSRKAVIESELVKLKAKKKIKKDVPQNARKRKESIKLSLELLNDPDVSETEKNLALRRIVDKIVFDRKKNKILIFYR